MLCMANDIGVTSTPRINNCALHWLQFSIPAQPQQIIYLLGSLCTDIFNLKISDFERSYNNLLGLMSYNTRYDYQGITILSDHFANCGIMVLLNGSACDKIAPDLEFIGQFINYHNGKVSRLDVAIDDYNGLLDLAVINKARMQNTVVTNFHKARAIDESDLRSGISTRPTIIFGSEKSDFQIRFYDKAAKEGLDYHWLRCELQFRNYHASAFLQEVITGKSLATVAMGILREKLSFRVPNGENRKRWKVVCAWWTEFLQAAEKLSLGVCKDRQQSSLDRQVLWLEKTVAPTLARFRRLYGINAIEDLCNKGEMRLNARLHRGQVAALKKAA